MNRFAERIQERLVEIILGGESERKNHSDGLGVVVPAKFYVRLEDLNVVFDDIGLRIKCIVISVDYRLRGKIVLERCFEGGEI